MGLRLFACILPKTQILKVTLAIRFNIRHHRANSLQFKAGLGEASACDALKLKRQCVQETPTADVGHTQLRMEFSKRETL